MHSPEHEERCLLYEAGELTEAERSAFAGALAACADCRDFLASIEACHRFCDAAGIAPDAALDARTLEGTPCRRHLSDGGRGRSGSALDRAPAGEPRPPRPRVSPRAAVGLTLAFSFAAVLAVFLIRPSSEPKDLEWSNGLDEKVAAAGEELEDISWSLGVGADSGDIDRELDDLEGAARQLRGVL
ncbi:MAG: hypothetical protein HY748_14475 [Elusimicrobia bacterium]|nr:hypothetical protein [Elusimicrobiota bacterium]